MTWSEHIPWGWLAGILGGLITGYVSGINAHRSALSRDAISRRRVFREFVLQFLDRMQTQSRNLRVNDYSATVPEIRRRSIIIAAEDIAFWKKTRFLNTLSSLEAYTTENIRPNIGPGDTQEDRDNRCKQMDAMRDRICHDLRRLIHLAK